MKRALVLLSLLLPCLILAAASFRPGVAPIQDDELAAGWKTLSASVFVQQAGEILDTTNARHRSELVEHAWSRFLNDAAFLANEEMSTVQAMVDAFASRSSDRLQAGVAQSVIDVDIENLRIGFAARLASEDWLTNQSFAEFLNRMQTIYNSGQSRQEASQYFARWMASNQWRSLSPGELSDLLEGLGQNDQVTISDMSARWTGSITAPGTDRYTFEIVRQFNNDPHYKLWVNGQIVLDSAEQPSSDAEFFTSQPVALTVGAPVSFRLEMASSSGDTSHSRGGPAAVLRWKAGDGQSQFVPSIAFSPPVGFAEGSGLKGEYFNSANFQDRVIDRLDKSLEFVWTWGAIAPVYQTQCQEVIDHCSPRLVNAQILDAIPADKRSEFVSDSVALLAGHLPLSARAQVADVLTVRSELLEATSAEAMSQFMRSIYLLPDDEHLKLLAAWTESRDQPRPQPGALHVNEAGSYSDNWLPFWQIGTLLQGPHWRDAETLLENDLERPNGECNLAIVYAAIFSAQDDSIAHGKPRARTMRELLRTKLADDSVVGDVRTTWLIARAFSEEWLGSHFPKFYQGKESLEEASLTAQSNEYQFWALQELAARYASMAETGKLTQLLTDRAGGFGLPEQQRVLNDCRTKCEELVAVYAEHERANEISANADYVADLKIRLQGAQQRGALGDVARFQQLLDSVSGQ